MEAEKEESEDEEMEDDGADVSRRASTSVVWILMVVNSLSENHPNLPTSTKEPLRWQTLWEALDVLVMICSFSTW